MTAERRVRHLALDAERREDVARAMIVLEDAFHTATLPSVAPGAVLAIKHVDLGDISIRRSPQAVARQLTERLRHIAARAVRYDQAAAAVAHAVYWPERSAVNASLVRRLLEGPAPREWFWQSAVPDWNPGAPIEHTLAALLLPAALPMPREAPPLVVAARAWRDLAATGAAARALVRLPPAAAAEHVRRYAVRDVPTERAEAEAEESLLAGGFERLTVRWRALLAWAVANLGPGDARVLWVAVCALVAERPELCATPRLPGWVRQLQREALRAAAKGVRLPLTAANGAAARVTARVVEGDGDFNSQRPAPERAIPSRPPAASPQPGDAGAAPKSSSAVEEAEHPQDRLDPFRARLRLPPLDAPAFTQFAGLLFALPILARLGFEALLASEPLLLEHAFGHEILHAILDRLGADPAEPMRRAMPTLEADPALRARCEPWVDAVAEHCARSRLDLTQVVRRRGIIAASATHIDIALPLGELLLEIRRQALDVTPGFVPWLGKVVSFHYLEDDDFDARVSALPVRQTS